MTEAAGGAPKPKPRPEPANGVRPRKERLPRAWVRVTAWIAGAAAFLVPWLAIGLQPKAAVSASGAKTKHRQRPVVIVHKVLRRVVVQDPPQGGVQYVYSGGGSTGSTSSYSGGSAPAPAPPPATSTGGS
jgi:uncharacterized membrane protein YgcG